MAQIPSRTKYKSSHRTHLWYCTKMPLLLVNSVSESLSRGRMTSRQIEAARVAMTRSLKRKGKVWIRVFPHKPVIKTRLKLEWVKVKAQLKNGWP